ncbi:MAG: hypothetical protein WCH39_02785 [Schlesneria sp.]
MSKKPLDLTPYEADPESRPMTLGLADGSYVYVQDTEGTIHILPDGPHRHPRIIGSAKPVDYAGDLTIVSGHVKDLTNLSGTYQFDDVCGLLKVAEAIQKLGFTLLPGAIRFFPIDGSRPVVLRLN